MIAEIVRDVDERPEGGLVDHQHARGHGGDDVRRRRTAVEDAQLADRLAGFEVRHGVGLRPSLEVNAEPPGENQVHLVSRRATHRQEHVTRREVAHFASTELPLDRLEADPVEHLERAQLARREHLPPGYTTLAPPFSTAQTESAARVRSPVLS